MHRSRFLSGIGACLCACAFAIVAAVPRAEAGYPGKLGQIAFDGDFGGLTEPEIFTMGPTGGPFAQLTFDVLGEAEDDEDPAFSGDGKRIVWEGDRVGLLEELFIMNADGSGQTRLTFDSAANDRADEDPAISWDGKRIVFERNDAVAPNDDEIFLINSDGSGLTQLTFNDVSDQEPVFSRDGRTIYFESNLDDPVSPEIWAMNVDGSGQRQAHLGARLLRATWMSRPTIAESSSRPLAQVRPRFS